MVSVTVLVSITILISIVKMNAVLSFAQVDGIDDRR